MRNFEQKVIDPILRIIRDNQEYLTLSENFPQLATEFIENFKQILDK